MRLKGAVLLSCALAVAACSDAENKAAPNQLGGDAAASSEASVAAKVPTPAVIAYGDNTLLFRHDCDIVRMYKNFLQALAGKEKDVKILYAEDDNCDPRQGSTCGIGKLESMQPFFAMIDEIGTIEFHRPNVDLGAYDVIIADFCQGDEYIIANETAIRTFVDTRGGLLVIGSFWCANGTVENSSARVASVFVERYGIEYRNDRGTDSAECVAVTESQEDFMAGVTTLSLRHVGTLAVSAPARRIFGTSPSSAPMAAVYERVLSAH
jgi:hypothetical protein